MFKNWTDVCSGKMTLKEVCREIFFYFYHKEPKRMVIDIKREKDGYHAKLWISNRDFKKWR